MKQLVNILNEGLTNKQSEIVGDLIFQMFTHSKLTKDGLLNLFKNVDLNIIKNIEQYIQNKDPQQSLAYMANDDDFLIKDNQPHIIDMLSDYFLKYVVQ